MQFMFYERQANGDGEIHGIGCRHRKWEFPVQRRIEVNATSIQDLARKVALHINDYGVASDYGMTTEQYVDAGMGFTVGTDKRDNIRIMPCVTI